jgi:hypothetical protein
MRTDVVQFRSAEDESLKDIVESTAAVVFLGTPHRGSRDIANIGEVIRKAASIVMDTSPFALDALALKNSDLSRCQESFSRLWFSYDFRVKTFQEGQGLTGMRFFNGKVGSGLELAH